MEAFSAQVNNFLEPVDLTKDIEPKINELSAKGKSTHDFGAEQKNVKSCKKSE